MISLAEDKLNREELINKIFNIFKNFGNQDGKGLTMVINGQYGSGKSTLLNFIQEKNKVENDFNIISYNAWENNYFDNPLIPLMYSLSKLESKENKVKNAIVKVVKSVPKRIFQTITNLTKIDVSCSKEIDCFEEFDKYRKVIEEYQLILAEYCRNKKLIFMVDELDRCLPEYQIKVLEMLYHFLNVPNLIVLIAIDKDKIETAIKNMFGIKTDVYGYLSKFIQYEIDLPTGNSCQYRLNLMKFKVNEDYHIKYLISNMFESGNISIRDSQILIERLNMICKEKKDGYHQVVPYKYYYPPQVAFLLILKHVDKNVYDKYFGKNIEREYDGVKKAFIETRFYNFMKDVENGYIENILNYLKTDNYGQAVLLQIVNMFDDIQYINEIELGEFVNRGEDNVLALIREHRFNSCYPENRNSLIQKLEIIL